MVDLLDVKKLLNIGKLQPIWSSIDRWFNWYPQLLLLLLQVGFNIPRLRCALIIHIWCQLHCYSV